ncbi:MAG: putative protein N(5)-glutamine methyltransferase [Nocardioidaceae bacterium]
MSRAEEHSPLVRDRLARRLRASGCVFAEEEAALLLAEARTSAQLEAMVERRAAGQPLEHVLGWAEFCDLQIAVDPGVFVPRRRTELLARQAVELARRAAHRRRRDHRDQPADRPTDRPSGAAAPVVVDLCCGSGAVGAAVIAALGPVELYAVDLDAAAVRCARRNLTPAGGQVYQGDLVEPLPTALRGRVDVLVANAPYVPTEQVRFLSPEARVHEPRVALDGGVDGLDVVRRLVAAAARWLAPGGSLLVETSERQAGLVVDALTSVNLVPLVIRCAELGATVVVGIRKADRADDPPSAGHQAGHRLVPAP